VGKFRQNVGRVDHVIFFYGSTAAAVDTQEKMTAVLGLDPDDWRPAAHVGPPFNITTRVNWPAGLEIVCPAEGHEQDWFGAPVIAERGEGIGMLVFGVPDIDEANARAEKLGLPIVQTLQDSRFPDGPDKVHAGPDYFYGPDIESAVKLIRESVIMPFNGTGLVFGQIEPLDD
jgi:hypothetical protein